MCLHTYPELMLLCISSCTMVIPTAIYKSAKCTRTIVRKTLSVIVDPEESLLVRLLSEDYSPLHSASLSRNTSSDKPYCQTLDTLKGGKALFCHQFWQTQRKAGSFGTNISRQPTARCNEKDIVQAAGVGVVYWSFLPDNIHQLINSARGAFRMKVLHHTHTDQAVHFLAKTPQC